MNGQENLKELRQIAKDKQLTGYSYVNKNVLIKMISEDLCWGSNGYYKKSDEKVDVEYDCGCCYTKRQHSYIMWNDKKEEEHYICQKCWEDFCDEDHPEYTEKDGWYHSMDVE